MKKKSFTAQYFAEIDAPTVDFLKSLPDPIIKDFMQEIIAKCRYIEYPYDVRSPYLPTYEVAMKLPFRKGIRPIDCLRPFIEKKKSGREWKKLLKEIDTYIASLGPSESNEDKENEEESTTKRKAMSNRGSGTRKRKVMKKEEESNAKEDKKGKKRLKKEEESSDKDQKGEKGEEKAEEGNAKEDKKEEKGEQKEESNATEDKKEEKGEKKEEESNAKGEKKEESNSKEDKKEEKGEKKEEKEDKKEEKERERISFDSLDFVLTEIIEQLRGVDLATAAAVCKKWNKILAEDPVWEHAFMNRWGQDLHPIRLGRMKDRKVSWKTHYIHQNRFSNQLSKGTLVFEARASEVEYLVAKIHNLHDPNDENPSLILHKILKVDKIGIDISEGPAYYFDPENTKKLCKLLQGISLEQIKAEFKPGTEGFPPYIHSKKMKSENVYEDGTVVGCGFINMLALFENAVRRGNGILRQKF